MKKQLHSICLYTDDQDLREFVVSSQQHSLYLSLFLLCVRVYKSLRSLIGCLLRWRSCQDGVISQRRRCRAWRSWRRWRGWALCLHPAALQTPNHTGKHSALRSSSSHLSLLFWIIPDDSSFNKVSVMTLSWLLCPRPCSTGWFRWSVWRQEVVRRFWRSCWVRGGLRRRGGSGGTSDWTGWGTGTRAARPPCSCPDSNTQVETNKPSDHQNRTKIHWSLLKDFTSLFSLCFCSIRADLLWLSVVVALPDRLARPAPGGGLDPEPAELRLLSVAWVNPGAGQQQHSVQLLPEGEHPGPAGQVRVLQHAVTVHQSTDKWQESVTAQLQHDRIYKMVVK